MSQPPLNAALPVARVTVYPQSALVTRRGRLALRRGEADVLLKGLPGGLTPDSLRVEVVEAEGLLLVDVSADSQPLEKPDGAEYEKLQNQYRDLLAEQKRLLARLANGQSELALFLNEENLAERFAREQYLPVNVANWKEFFGFLRERLTENRVLHRENLFALLDLERKMAAASANLAALPGQPDSEHEIRVTLRSPGDGEYTLGVSYLQEQAFWYPVYALAGDPRLKQLTVALSAVIGQETGEDWKDVDILLSTAVPRFSCSLPDIRSKRLRERDAEIAIKKTESADKPARREEYAKVMAEAVDGEMPMELSAPAPMRSRHAPKKKAFADNRAAPAVPAVDRGGKSMPAQPLGGVQAAPFGQAPTAQSVPVVESGKIIRGALERFDGEVRAAFASPPEVPYLAELEQVMFGAGGVPSLPEEAEGLPEWMSRGISPLESLGGYDYRFPVPGKRDVPSSSVPSKLSVARKELPVTFTYVAVPLEKEAVFLRADFANDRDNPLPAGPAQVFSGDNLIGSLDFRTLAPGEKGTVSLGAERDIKVVRRRNSLRRRRGVVAREVITDYTVDIEFASFRDEPVRLEVYDRLPDAQEHKEISVGDFSAEPKPLVTERQILVWRLDVPPRGKQAVRFRYSIRHPQNFRLVMEEDPQPHMLAEEK
jgi:hypothetical protein